MPLVNPVRFVRVIHVPERIVYGDGLDFVLLAHGRRAEGPEAADELRADAAAARVDEPVLPEVTLARPFFRRDDGEDGSVAAAPIEADAHRRSGVTVLVLQNRNASEIDEPPVGADRSGRLCSWRRRRSVATAMSTVRPASCHPYSTSTLFGRSMPETICRICPSMPNTTMAPAGAATFIVPMIRLRDGSVGMHPDRGIVGIVGERRRAVLGLDLHRLRQRRGRRRRLRRVLVRRRRSRRHPGETSRRGRPAQPARSTEDVRRVLTSQNLNFSPS